MTTEVVTTITFGILVLIALAGLLDAGAELVKLTRNSSEPGSGGWLASHIPLLRMPPRPTVIFLVVMVMSLLDYLFSRWIPLAWLGAACLGVALVYGRLGEVVRWAYGDAKPRNGHQPAEGQSFAPSQRGEAAPGAGFTAWAPREPSLAPDQYTAVGSPSGVQRPPLPGTTKLRSNADVRWTGFALLLGAAAASYLFIYLPLAEAIKGAQHISYYPEMIAIIPIVMIIGLVFVVFGAQGYALMQKRPKGLLLVLYIVLFLLYVFGCMGITDFVMHNLGYQ